MSVRPVQVSIEAAFDLALDEVWPDRDGPAEPTAADVIVQMKKSGTIRRLLDDWNMQPEEVHVRLGDTADSWVAS